jgi:uncharacterized protein DUF5925
VTHSGQALPRLAAVSDAASLDPARLLPPVLRADDSDTPADIVDALALAPFTAGTQPYASTTRLSEVRPEAPLLPPGAAEASTLLGRTVAGPHTLAEVYAIRNGLPVERPAESGTGQYL